MRPNRAICNHARQQTVQLFEKPRLVPQKFTGLVRHAGGIGNDPVMAKLT